MGSPDYIAIDEITGYWSYLMSIDWKDPWLIGLVLFHVLTTTTALLTFNRANLQIFLFMILLGFAYFSESINKLASIHWQKFSKQQYFDSNGLFISTVFSIPILLNCMLLIGTWLYNSTQVMTKLKTAQLKQKLLQERAARSGQTNDHAKED